MLIARCHLMGYVDSDYAIDCESRRSFFGFVFSVQFVVALSTIESEHIVAIDGFKEAICLKKKTN